MSLLDQVQDARLLVPGSLSLIFFFIKLPNSLLVILFSLSLTHSALAYENNSEVHSLKKNLKPLRQQIDLQSQTQKKAMEQKMLKAAELYERQFLSEMVKAMRSTIQYSKYSQPTMAERIYNDKLYENYVDKWSQRGGVGFKEIIYKQMLEKYSPYHRPQQPLANNGALPLEKSSPKVLKSNRDGKNIPRLKSQ